MPSSRVRRENFKGLLNPDQAIFVLNWGRHTRYRIVRGQIYGEGDDGQAYQPLNEPDLFLSFARLSRRGKPSESSILKWVERYGLLEYGDEPQGLNQKPLGVDEFREESRCAYQLLTLYAEILAQDYSAIRDRYLGYGRHSDAAYHSNPVDQYFVIYQRDPGSEHRFEVANVVQQHDLVQAAIVALENLVTELVQRVNLSPRSFVGTRISRPNHERHGTSYKPTLSWHCPDLRSALYLQFCLMLVDNKPIDYCQNPHCRMPFQVTRKDRFYCTPGCRKYEADGTRRDNKRPVLDSS